MNKIKRCNKKVDNINIEQKVWNSMKESKGTSWGKCFMVHIPGSSPLGLCQLLAYSPGDGQQAV